MNLYLSSINVKVVYAGIFCFVGYVLIEYFYSGFGQTFSFAHVGLAPFFGLGGSPGSESGSAGASQGSAFGGISCNSCSQSQYSSAAAAAGYDVTNSNGFSSAVGPGGQTSSWSGNAPSTPFLKVWDGKKYVFENDFLFGKPQTSFATYEQGLSAYEKGIGGDTYVLRTTPALTEGKLQFQIREIEPEESYIDTFVMHMLDLAPQEALVVDGNLKDLYVFDTTQSILAAQQRVRHYHKKQGSFTDIQFGTSDTFTTHDGSGVLLEAGDELIVTVPRAFLTKEDTYIMVDSYFRDWTLGDSVPFSALDRFTISSWALGRSLVTTAFGISLVLGATLATSALQHDSLKRIITTPYAHADIPHLGGSSGGRSLKLSVLVGGTRFHLETLFPRFVQASKEVVKIPQSLLSQITTEMVTVCIEATKRHKVTFASLVTGKMHIPQLTVFKDMQVVNVKTGEDVSEVVQNRDGNFVHTKPGDVFNVSIGNIQSAQEGMTRHYILKAHGFYTKLSDATKQEIGNNWYQKLEQEDRTLLRQLKQFNV